MSRRALAGVVCCCVLPFTLLLELAQQALLDIGALNRKDLAPFVGNEPGTVWEHVFNVWHWDGAILALLLLAVPCSVAGVWLLSTRKRQAAAAPSAA
jgi:hypothetical protein